MYNFIFKFGESIINSFYFFLGYSKFALKVASKGLFKGNLFNYAVFNMTMRQIYFTGFEIFIIMTTTSLILGIALVGGMSKLFISIGASESIGTAIVIVIIRMVAPITSGLILMLRSSTTILFEIISMKHKNEILALEAMGIDPYCLVYLPRIVASVISMLVLSTYFVVISVIGGYTLLSFQLNTSLDFIMGQVIDNINLSDIISFLFKTILIGYILVSIPIYMALLSQNTQINIIKTFVTGMMNLFYFFILIILLGELI